MILGLSAWGVVGVGGGEPSLEVLVTRFRFFGLTLAVGTAEEHKASINISDSIKAAAMRERWRNDGINFKDIFRRYLRVQLVWFIEGSANNGHYERVKVNRRKVKDVAGFRMFGGRLMRFRYWSNLIRNFIMAFLHLTH